MDILNCQGLTVPERRKEVRKSLQSVFAYPDIDE